MDGLIIDLLFFYSLKRAMKVVDAKFGMFLFE